MKQLDLAERSQALALAAVAGFIDSVGFLYLGGLFVSFMSGNSTRLGVSLGGGDMGTALLALGLLVLFVVGATLGGLVAGGGDSRARFRVLASEALLLAGGAVAATIGMPGLGIILMVLAMGVENAVYIRNGEVGVSLTYMTGTLVKAGHAIARAIRGGERWAFAPHLMLWTGLVAGAVTGAAVYGRLGLAALYPAALVVGALAIRSRFTRAA